MTALADMQRDALRRAVERGRVVAEAAASAAVSRLGVGVEPAPGYLVEGERELRRALRARARQLGDDPAAGGVTLLVREVAYEQWHRLLFARFLEVNGLLWHPEYGVSVSLAECEELAGELGEPDGWSVAGRFAAEILPGIFRPADPSVRVRLATDDLVRLEEVVTGLPAEVFTAEDALGWVYQFWQSQAKAEVNASGRKIGGADLSPVTQLFTENYMVRFLLENSLGAWWAARRPDSPLLRQFEYLRFAEDGTPAAGAFEGWPGSVAEVTVMDPCCGSGHFLVAAFGMLWRMRAEEEGLSEAAAQEAVLRDNLFGLELDPRCTQIAMFALALEAWKAGGYRPLPVPNVACSGIPAKAPLAEWAKLADGDPRVEAALTRLHALFRDADTLGSLIDPVRATEQAGQDPLDWHDIAPLLEKALTAERTDDPAAAVFGDAAAGTARAADLLTRTYTLVATNPPYLGINNHGEVLYGALSANHYLSRHDLALAMTDRSTMLVARQGRVAIVMPAEWLFVARLEDMRRDWLSRLDINIVAALGYLAFKTTLRVNPALVVFAADGPGSVDGRFGYLDVGAAKSPLRKARGLADDSFVLVSQRQQLSNPAAIVMPGGVSDSARLDEFVESAEGISTGDANRFERKYWEVDVSKDSWELLHDASSETNHFAGRTDVLLWEKEQGQLAALAASVRHLNHAAQNWRRGKPYWGKRGVVINLLGHLRASLYTGDMFGKNCTVLIPRDQSLVPALWHFAASGELESTVRSFHSKMDISPGVLHKVPFNVERWRVAAEAAGPLPEPFSDDPTQWLFRGQPVGSTAPLQVAVGRLLGFRWPDQEPDALDGLADTDGIVCLPAVGGERPAVDRLVELLARAYGNQWSPSLLDGLLTEAGGRPGDLAGWLRDVFFKDHCRVFGNRPFVWHVWDGRRDGFSALLNYHRLDRSTLAKLTYNTLGWWIERQRADAEAGLTGAELRLAAAVDLQRKLVLILEGEPPYDLYVRWKPLAEQPIGWEPDLDDGVRLNIRPFVEAGVLRSKFTIHWKKDRGTNPDGTERHNDRHHTTTEKRTARGAK
jgi:hypothetical protein